ncbi:MAG: tRNA (guanosine(46)-N7)-methyltransferase TrmB [Alphaproteobacteria bacterium]|nr:tRNA (guanosine(46)-N7)-methyltransferase TrmB [Alphaproteobacteria bacterium]
MEKQEIRTFGRRHGKKLSPRKQLLLETVLPAFLPKNIKNAGNLILEIGFGNGEHVRDLAIRNPESIIIGAEPFMNGVAALLSAITNESTNEIMDEYKNIRIWPDDVRKMFNELDAKFNEIWVLHPDPWPKARHEKRRLLNADFLSVLGTKLMPNGQIIIGTDHWEYFDWIIEQSKKTALNASFPAQSVIHTRYAEKNMAGTTEPKYLILTNQ